MYMARSSRRLALVPTHDTLRMWHMTNARPCHSQPVNVTKAWGMQGAATDTIH